MKFLMVISLQNSFAVPKPTSLSSKYPQPSSGSGYFPPMYYHPPLPFPPSFHGYHPYYPGFYQSPGPVGGVPFNPFLRNGLRGAKVTVSLLFLFFFEEHFFVKCHDIIKSIKNRVIIFFFF